MASFNLDKLFEGKNVHYEVYLFNKTILNIFQNSIPNEIIICNDKDLPWVKDKIRQVMSKKNYLFKQLINNSKLQSDYNPLQCIRSDFEEFIRSSKEKFYLRLFAKLPNPSTSAKTYWSLFKSFVKGN